MVANGISSRYVQTQSNSRERAAYRAEQLYDQALNRNRLGALWSNLRGRPNRLLDLSVVHASATVTGHDYIGRRQVPISEIRGSGSSGRSRDFDADFRPLKSHSQARWVSVATAWQRGANLPPVKLTQVGDTYFVEDGHHRISVARALGHTEIDAVVTVWQVA